MHYACHRRILYMQDLGYEKKSITIIYLTASIIAKLITASDFNASSVDKEVS